MRLFVLVVMWLNVIVFVFVEMIVLLKFMQEREREVSNNEKGRRE